MRSVLSGNTRGRVWVDDLARPGAAYLWDEGPCHFLGGSPSPGRIEAVRALLMGEIRPSILATGRFWAKLAFPPAWSEAMPAVLAELRLQRRARLFLTLAEPLLPDWQHRVPAGCRVAPIDDDLLSDRLRYHEAVVAEIRGGWPSIETFLAVGLGRCLVCGDAIACWCTAEFVSEGECGIGIETARDYRGRGYATLTAAAFVADCRARGITPHWDAWANNAPSLAVARKVGFVKECDYAVYFGDLRE
jgi:RimJ/RimL family protein N-acetyltransferase